MTTSLFLDFTPNAQGELSAALESTRAYQGDEAAETFAKKVSDLFAGELEKLAEEVNANPNGKPFDNPDGAASIRDAKDEAVRRGFGSHITP